MEAIEDMIECSICLETFTDPRALPCLHTFCLKCLQQIVLKTEEQRSTNKLHCPSCRKEYVIPPEGVEGFQKNFFMHRLKERKTMKKPLDKSCDICLESMECDEDEILPADVYCLQCRKNICRRCSKAHKVIADLKVHELIPLGTEITESMIKTISHQDCPHPTTEQEKRYCSECKEVVCADCFTDNHQNHNRSEVEKLEDMFAQKLKEAMSDVENCLTESLMQMQQCTDKKVNFQMNVESIEQAIIKRKSELVDIIDESVHSLLEELASIRQARLKQIQDEIDENKKQLATIESFKAYCEQMEEKGANMELSQAVSELQCSVDEIQQAHRTLCQHSTEGIQLYFEQTNFGELLKTGNAIGKIKVVSDSILIKGNLDIPPFSRVYGVTKLENKICIMCREPNVIRIFHDQFSFDLQMEIELKQIEKPYDMASCEKSKCIYVKEEGNRCIWKITTDDRRVTEWLTQGVLFRKPWLTDVRKGRGSLSVTREGHLLLITRGQPPELDIFNSDAKLIRRVHLPSDIYEPQHIVCKPNGEFIVCHREINKDGPWVISRLTGDGQTVVSRFNPMAKAYELNEACHLVLDSDNDRLFLADCENDRVILFDSTSLNLVKFLLKGNDNEMSRPTRLFYDCSKKQLIVGQWPDKVDVYEVNHL